jgi:viroplasmin and RNaseH domain-containing protein
MPMVLLTLMAGKKFYAIVLPNGKHHVEEATWEKVQPLVNGVSGAKFKGFPSKEAAEEWASQTSIEVQDSAKAKAKKKEIEKNNAFSHSEWMINQVNTPHWNAIRRNKKRISEG